MPFDPTAIAGFVAWFKADAQSYANGDPITSFVDSGGNGWNLDQTPTSPGTLPVFHTNVINSLPAARFNGTNQTIGSFTLPMSTRPKTIFLVLSLRSTSQDGWFMDSNGGHYAGLLYDSTGHQIEQDSNSVFLNPIAFAADGFHIMTQKLNGASTYLYKDGVATGPSDTGSHSWTDGFWLGSLYYGSAPISCDIAEVLVYSAALNDTDRGAVESYLESKYGIGVVPIVPGTITKSSDTPTTVRLSCTAPSGGTAPYTYQWYRSLSNGFTPGVGNMVSGATSLILSDSGLLAGQTYYYKLGITDSAGTPAIAYTSQFTETTPASTASVSFGIIGDSIAAGYLLVNQADPAAQMVKFLDKFKTVNLTYTEVNKAVVGATTNDWLSTSGGTAMANALTAFASASVNVAVIMLGTNDSKNSVSAATYKANIQTIIATLKAHGITKIILNQPPYIIPSSASGGIPDPTADNALLVQYQTALAAVVAADPSHVALGDTLAYNWFMNNQSDADDDGIHPNDNGAISLGFLWAQGYGAFGSGSSPTAAGGPVLYVPSGGPTVLK